MGNLKDRKVAILTENGFEQVELIDPRQAMEEAGVTVHIVSPQQKEVRAWDETDWGITVSVDKKLDDANPGDYDGLMLPGGVLNPDKLRTNKKAVDFYPAFPRGVKTDCGDLSWPANPDRDRHAARTHHDVVPGNQDGPR